VGTELAALAVRYHRAFNDRDFDVWREVFDEDVELLIDGMSFRGVDAAVAYGVGNVSQFPGLRIASERIVAESDDTIVTEIRLVTGDPDGGQVRQQGTACEICWVRDGRIVSVRSYYMPEPADRVDAVRVPARGEAGAVAEEQAALELRSFAEEQAAQRRVAMLVATGAPPAEVFAAVAAEVGRLLAVDFTVLVRSDPHDMITVVGTWTCTGAVAPSPVGRRFELGGRNVSTLALRTGRPARLDAYADVTGAIGNTGSRDWGFRSSVGVPISVEGRPWGLIIVAYTRDQPLPASTEARLAAFTELVATAIANAQAHVELRGHDETQAALRRVATLVAQAAPPDEVFAAVTAEAGQLLAVDFTFLSRYDPDGAVMVVGGWNSTDDAVPLPIGSRLTVGGRNVHTLVYETHRPARTDRADASGPAADVFRGQGIRSCVGAPISVAGRLWGALGVAYTREEPLPADTEIRLAGFTELVATAIGNAQARTELRSFAEEQAALRRVATLVATGAPPEEVFAAVSEEAGRVLSADFTGLGRYEPDGAVTFVGLWSSTGAALPIASDTRVDLGGRNATTLVFQTGRPARDDIADATGPVVDLAREVGIRTSVGVPISIEGRLWGVVTVSSRSSSLPADTETRLAGFTELVGTAIANAEAQAALTASRARIVAAADTTRRRIERDLHDGAQQRLVSLALQLRGSVQASPRADTHQLTAQMDLVADGLTGVLEELREIARGLHPAALAEGGLRTALKALARRSAVPVRLDVRVDRRLPEPIELAAYYVVSEALTNAAKHASAALIDIDVTADAGTLRVCVRDDGRGGADLTRGSGLVGLTDRVEALGGRLTLHSPPEAGTTMQIALPLIAPAALRPPR
jgi:signal transduction histidine kinase/ketosteroid isomerase-like protein